MDHAWTMISGPFDPQEIVDSISFFGFVDNVDHYFFYLIDYKYICMYGRAAPSRQRFKIMVHMVHIVHKWPALVSTTLNGSCAR